MVIPIRGLQRLETEMTEPNMANAASGVRSGDVMENWRVIWEIDIEAAGAEEAARKALGIMRDNTPGNTAVVFQCVNEAGSPHVVDLLVELAGD